MASRPLVEHLVFPGLSREEAVLLEERLEAVGSAARLFGSGLLGRDVDVTLTLGRPQPIQWMRARDGSLSVRLWVDLLSPVDLPASVLEDAGEGGTTLPSPDAYLAAFQSGFLHALGRVLGAGLPPSDPIDSALQTTNPRWNRLPTPVRKRLAEYDGKALVTALFDELEGARTDGILIRRFRGARRHLVGRLERARRLTEATYPVEAALGYLHLLAREPSSDELAVARERAAGENQPLSARLSRLGELLSQVVELEGRRGRVALAEFVVYDLLRALLEIDEEFAVRVVETSTEEVGGEARRSRSLARFAHGEPEVSPEIDPERLGSHVIFLPHTQGGLSIVRIERAEASAIAPDKITRRVLRRMLESYGPQAVAAFAEQSAALRRALGVNWERRYRGRYRSGKRVGMDNLRRFVMQEDLRLFQRLQVPDTVSYYFHLLVDTSYSMLEAQNAEKAFAIAYAFTALLRSLRVPVDVTLYASGVTDLYDHRTDILEPYFGREFGYLVSGTLELEAVAYAKEKADRVHERRKILVVITDGTPAGITLPHLGASSLSGYYRTTLIPWLREAGIELMAIGIGVEPDYHERAVSLSEGWQAIPVLMGLLEEIVSEGQQQEEDLWV